MQMEKTKQNTEKEKFLEEKPNQLIYDYRHPTFS